jgi:hypothetical protein
VEVHTLIRNFLVSATFDRVVRVEEKETESNLFNHGAVNIPPFHGSFLDGNSFNIEVDGQSYTITVEKTK